MAAATKDAYYFRHDSNTRNDPKIIKLRRILGREGSDVFFDVLSLLREQSGYQLPEATIPDIAYSLRYPEVKLRKLLTEFDLFTNAEGFFYSERLKRDMTEWDAQKLVYQQRGKKGGEAKARNKSTSSIEQADNNSASTLAINKVNKEDKINKREYSTRAPELSPSRGEHCPTWQAVVECFVRLGQPDKAFEFFEYWEALNWMKGVTPIVNFSSFANRWLSNPISQAEKKFEGRKVIMLHNMSGAEDTWTEQEYQRYCAETGSGYKFLRYE